MDPQIKAVELRVQALELSHVSLRAELEKNTSVTASIKADTADIVEYFKAGQGTFKVLGLIGKGIKWVGGIAVSLGAIYAAWKYGSPP